MAERITEIAGLRITENTDLLCVGTDALLCAAYVRPSSKARAVELGAGNGIISLLCLARNKFAYADAVEIDPVAAELCRRNVEENGFSGRITALRRDIRELVPAEHTGASIVITNPPYMKTESGKSCKSDKMEAARHEHNGDIYDFCRAAARLLKTGGSFYVVYRPDRLPALMDALTENRLSPKRMTFVHSDEYHSPSSVLVEARKDGGEAVYVTPPLILRRNGRDSEELTYIYESGSFPKKFLTP